MKGENRVSALYKGRRHQDSLAILVGSRYWLPKDDTEVVHLTRNLYCCVKERMHETNEPEFSGRGSHS
jgi:hypothetical protein